VFKDTVSTKNIPQEIIIIGNDNNGIGAGNVSINSADVLTINAEQASYYSYSLAEDELSGISNLIISSKRTD